MQDQDREQRVRFLASGVCIAQHQQAPSQLSTTVPGNERTGTRRQRLVCLLPIFGTTLSIRWCNALSYKDLFSDSFWIACIIFKLTYYPNHFFFLWYRELLSPLSHHWVLLISSTSGPVLHDHLFLSCLENCILDRVVGSYPVSVDDSTISYLDFFVKTFLVKIKKKFIQNQYHHLFVESDESFLFHFYG